jgi:hypothetical protein
MNADLCIASGTTRLRLPSPGNHKVYAEIHGTDYRLECGPIASMKDPMRYFKLTCMLRILPRYDWVFWLDDDAFFTNFAFDIRDVIRSAPSTAFLLMADGRVQPPSGDFTVVNAGVVLMKNCPEALAFLQRCVDVQSHLSVLTGWWDPVKHGMYTHGDQDAWVYQILNTLDPSQYVIVPHRQLNARQYHYGDRLDEHFICHFPGVSGKLGALRKFADRFGVGPALVPGAVLTANGFSYDDLTEILHLPRRPFGERVVRRARAAIRRVVP